MQTSKNFSNTPNNSKRLSAPSPAKVDHRTIFQISLDLANERWNEKQVRNRLDSVLKYCDVPVWNPLITSSPQTPAPASEITAPYPTGESLIHSLIFQNN